MHPHDAAEHIYVHVPFCDGKCSYCALYSEPYDKGAADAFLAALDAEFRMRLSDRPRPKPLTIYVGGGTPTVLKAAQTARLLSILQGHLQLDRLVEWTFETRPATAFVSDLGPLRRAGVNRISIGAQTFDAGLLRALNRRHSAEDIAKAVGACRRQGFDNVGLDLIAGLPNSTSSIWLHSCRQALALQPQHVSVYALTVEPGSQLHEAIGHGHVGPPDDEHALRQIASARRIFADAGLRRYEISNFAQPGRVCIHNEAFWQGEDYLGFGPGAAARSGAERRANDPSLSAYVDALEAGRPPPGESETLTRQRDIAERLSFAFRLANGIDMAQFEARWRPAPALVQRWRQTFARLEEDGLVKRTGSRIAPTARGYDFADHTAAAIFTDAE